VDLAVSLLRILGLLVRHGECTEPYEEARQGFMERLLQISKKLRSVILVLLTSDMVYIPPEPPVLVNKEVPKPPTDGNEADDSDTEQGTLTLILLWNANSCNVTT
jgi:hypothetical protein